MKISSVAIAALALTLIVEPVTGAQEPAAPIELNIPAQPLAEALNALAKQSHLYILFESEWAAGRTAPSLSGTFSVRDALERLLADTNLGFEFADARTITLVRKSAGTESTTGMAGGESSPNLRLATAGPEEGLGSRRLTSGPSLRLAQAQTAGKEDGGLEEIVVTSQISFTQNDAFGATKMGLDIKDTPFSVLPLTRDVLDLASIRLRSDLAKLDPSGGRNGRDGGQSKSFSRGSLTEERIDGFRSVFYNVDNDLASYERVELIKGGVSTLYGQAEAGGLVNYVSKLPETAAGANFKVEAGDDNYRRVEGDLTGPLLGSEKWSYRVVAVGQNDDTFRDHSRDDRVSVVPSLMYRGESSSLILRGRYQRQKVSYSLTDAVFQLDRPVPDEMSYQEALGSGLIALRPISDVNDDMPRSRWFAADGSGTSNEVSMIQLQHEYRLPSNWQIRTNVQYAKTDIHGRWSFALGPYDVSGDPSFELEVDSKSRTTTTSAEVNLFGDFGLLGRQHTLFFGVDYAERSEPWAELGAGDFNFGAGTVLNMFDPDYAAAANLVSLSPEQVEAFNSYARDSTYLGATVQVILKPTDRLSILLGGRYSFGSSGNAFDGTPRARNPALDVAGGLDTDTARTVFNRFSKQAGITYAITDQINAYASVAENFLPTSERLFAPDSPTGGPIDPLVSETYEAGFKARFAGPWELAIAGFQLEENTVFADPNHPTFALEAPGWRNRGVELSAQGKIGESLSVFGGVARQRAVYTHEPYEGMRSPVAPELGVTLFGTYEFLGGSLRGLGLGAGIVHKGGRKLTANDVTIASTGERFILDIGDYTTVDARVFYNRDRWQIYGSATNLTDERYVEAEPYTGLLIGWATPGRQFRVGASVNF